VTSAYAPDPRPKALVKAKIGKAAGGSAAAALALAMVLIAAREGEVRHTYTDINGKLTYCFGSTAGAVRGKTYTHAECLAALQQDAAAHAAEIAPCLPASLPAPTRAAFISAGYNMGAPTFCRSSMSRRAKAGDLPGACAALSLYVFSGGMNCRLAASRCSGIVKRRVAERELCERGLGAAG
jgi:lysozyme